MPVSFQWFGKTTHSILKIEVRLCFLASLICLFILRKFFDHMARILTGIQSSARPHLGNILGAILPAIRLSEDEKNESFYFIADLHSLTTIKDAQTRKDNVLAVSAAWLAFGFNTEKTCYIASQKSPKFAKRPDLVPQLPHTLSHVGQCPFIQRQI